MSASDWTKLWSGYGEDWTQDGARIQESYIVEWSDKDVARDDFINEPHKDFPWLLGESVNVTAFDKADSDSGGPKFARINVTYIDENNSSNVQNEWSDWTEQWEAGGEALTIGEGFEWSTDGEPLNKTNTSAVKIYPHATISITGKTDKIDKTKILNCVGKVNSDAVSIKGFNYGAEKLLFDGIGNGEQVVPGSDLLTNQMTFRFMYRHNTTWNKFYRKDSGAFEAVRNSANSDAAYDTADFDNLNPSNW